jgi:hypothetical protein
MIGDVPNVMCDRDGNTENTRWLYGRTNYVNEENESSVDVLDIIHLVNEEDTYSSSAIQNSHRLKDERVCSLERTAAHTAVTTTIELRPEAPFNLIEMERRLIFGPFFLVSMP